VKEWERLDSLADVRRFLRWVVHSFRNRSLERQDAAVFSQLALALIKTLQDVDLERRLVAIETVLASPEFQEWKQTNGYQQQRSSPTAGER